MATKKKAEVKKPDMKPLKGGKAKNAEEQEPLSEFQEPKTGRTDVPLPAPALPKSAITIEKVKMEKDDALFVVFSKIANGSTSHHSDTFEQRMHPDLKGKFREFRVHLALLCDYISTQQVKDLDKYNQELVDKFNVSSVSIKEDGCVITGYKITKSGKAVILNTPFTLFESEGENSYHYAEELETLIGQFVAEVLQYLDGSKKGEDPQQSIEFPEEKYADEAR